MAILALLALAAGTIPVIRYAARVRGTTLWVAYGWLVAAWLALMACGVFQALASARLISSAHAGESRFLVAVLFLCPPIAVLGARRPTNRVWSWFVVLPLLCALCWSPLAAWWGGTTRAGQWEVEDPVLLGFGLVLVMGAGNHLGTRFTLVSLLGTLAQLVNVLSLTPRTSDWVAFVPAPFETSCILWGLCAWLGWWLEGESPHGGNHRLDALWLEFRDHFGIVWAKRIQERFNDLAGKNGFGVELTPFGFVPQNVPAGTTRTPHAEAAIEAALRWFLRRFVDAGWIDARILQRLPRPKETHGVQEQLN